jgi:hypothetical protein
MEDTDSAENRERLYSRVNSHDATDHVAGDRDALGPQVGVRLSTEGSLSSGGQTGSRGQSTSFRPPPITSKLGSSSAHPPLSTSKRGGSTSSSDSASRTGNGSSTETAGQDTLISGSTRLVVDSSLTPVPVTQQAFSDLVNSLLDGFDVALDLDNSLGRLRKHLLRSDHTGTGSVLDLLDRCSGLSDDRTHEVVGDEQTHRSKGVAGQVLRVGERGLQEGLGNLSESLHNRVERV